LSKRRKTESASRRPKGQRVRIVIADDEPLILDQISGLLETRFEVVARAGNGHELLQRVKRFKPAVVVTDITMPELDGIEAARRITKTSPSVKVVILSVYADGGFVEAAFDAGASAYVVKLSAFTELVPAIDSILAGQSYCSSDAHYPQ